MSAPATPAAPAATSPRRAWIGWVALGVGFVVIASVLAMLAGVSRMPAAGLLDPDSAGQGGSRALVQILRSQGVEVTVARGREEWEQAVNAQPDSAYTLVVGSTNPLTDDDTTALLTGADTVVIVNPTTRDMRVAFDGRTGGAARDPLAADCAWPVAQAAGEVTIGTTLSAPGATYSCFPSDGNYGLIADDRSGATVIAVDGAALLTNERLTSAGNAALGVALLGTQPRVVWYEPQLGDSPSIAAPTIAELTPDWVSPVLVLLAVAGLAAVLWKGRRFGPLVAENLPVTVRASETTAGRARMYARSRDATHAVDQLRVGTLRRLARTLGMSAGAAASDVADAVAARLGRDAGAVRSILITDTAPTDRELVALADQLRELETSLTRALRPERKNP